MKIKFLLSVAVLISVFGMETAGAIIGSSDGNGDFATDGGSGAGAAESSPSSEPTLVGCKNDQIVVTKNGRSDCEKGEDFCKNKPQPTDTDFEYAFDEKSQACYMKIKSTGDLNIGQSSILPYTELTVAECESLYADDASSLDLFKNFLAQKPDSIIPKYTFKAGTLQAGDKIEVKARMDILGCGIKTGRMKLWMIPYYIKFLIQFALSIAGIVAVGAMVVGGYLYMFGSIMDDKERGKRSIIYGIGGFVLVLLAWAIVNVVISLATM